MVKFENWQIILVIIGVVLLIKVLPSGFLGSISGICSSNEIAAQEDLLLDVTGWEFNGFNGSLTTVYGGVPVVYFGSALTTDVPQLITLDIASMGNENLTCKNAILHHAALSADANENSSVSTIYEGPTQVIVIKKASLSDAGDAGLVFDTWYAWCNAAKPSIYVGTNSEGLKDKYFGKFYTCVECQAGEVENKTCSDGSKIEYRKCSATGNWDVMNSCPAAVTGAKRSGTAAGSVKPDCVTGEIYDAVQHKCIVMEVSISAVQKGESTGLIFGFSKWVVLGVVGAFVLFFVVWYFAKKR